MSNPAFCCTTSRATCGRGVAKAEAHGTTPAAVAPQCSRANSQRSANGESATMPTTDVSRAACNSTAAAPVSRPQKPICEKPKCRRRPSSNRKSSRSWKPQDTSSPPLWPAPDRSRHARAMPKGSSAGTSSKASSRQPFSAPWAKTTQVWHFSRAEPKGVGGEGSNSVHTNSMPRTFFKQKSVRWAGMPQTSKAPSGKWATSSSFV
mmetsp:Transcript_142772/g.455829  ORF Transcript_142772/g.455829 Transcript_142772/m.455829 type:complete len:206 (+) Transcript_142772:3133-3750(+)